MEFGRKIQRSFSYQKKENLTILDEIFLKPVNVQIQEQIFLEL